MDTEGQAPESSDLAQKLLQTGLIDRAQLQQAVQADRDNAKGLVYNLVALGLVDEQALLRALGEQFGLFVMDLAGIDVQQLPSLTLQRGFLRRHHCLPLLKSGIELTVATLDPTDRSGLELLRLQSGGAIRPVLVSPLQLDALIEVVEGAAPAAALDEAISEDEAEADAAPPATDLEARADGLTHSLDRYARDLGAPAATADYETVPVYYATDRARAEGKAADSEYFTGRRMAGDSLQYGRCMVSIPKDHRIGKVERPSWLRLQFREDPAKHVMILKWVEFEAPALYAELRAYLAGLEEPGVLVFVHGYNVGFAEAVRRTAQIAYDLQFQGPAVSYSWPSEGGVLDYPTDEGNARWSKARFRQFIADLRRELNAPYVHLIAHSMGSRVVAEALGDGDADAQWAQVIFAAPDIDADVFKELTGTFRGHVQRITLYASSNDKALKLSCKLHGGYARAGETSQGVRVFDGVDCIDASAVDTGLLGHSYYGDNRSVVSDIYHLLANNIDPDQRFGMQAGQDAKGQRYWAFRP